MTTVTTPNSTYTNSYTSNQNVGTTIPFDGICEPGAYICNWSGHLLRVSQDCYQPNRNSSFNLVGSEPLMVTKISENPFVTISRAKLIASNLNLETNF